MARSRMITRNTLDEIKTNQIMKKKPLFRQLTLSGYLSMFLMTTTLVGCGQKGPLTLPDDPAKNQQEQEQTPQNSQ